MWSLERYLLLLVALPVLGGAFVPKSAALVMPSPMIAGAGNAKLNRADVSQEQETLSQQRRIPAAVGMVGQAFDPTKADVVPLQMPPESRFSPLEVWCLVRIEKEYAKALNRKCPFLRRRMTDMIEVLEMMVRIAVIRQEKSDLVGPPVSCRGDQRTRHKVQHLPLSKLATIIRRDWKEESQKGYYITGLLTPAIYRDDCMFDGPDPDMPVKGLRKFLNAASQLFDPKQSACELLSLEIQGDVIVADWKMNGVLRLPWRPRLPEVHGQTTYHLDENGLIARHAETWDLSAVEAFLKTAWFDFQLKAANTHNEKVNEELQEVLQDI